MEQEHDLTQGSLVRTVVVFAIPFLLANLIQAFYGAADLMVVGWYCGRDAVAAVSTGTQVTQIITSMITGLTLGSTVLVGNYTGQKRPEEVKKIIGTSFCLFAGAGVVLSVLLFLFCPRILTALQTPEEAYELAGQYVQVCACGVVFICGYNAISAVLRGCGDSKSPLLFVAVAGCMNVVGDIVLVKYFHMGVRGTAFATIFSQGFSMVCAALYLNKRNFIFQFRLKNFRMDRGKAGELIKVGIPISFQECMVRLSLNGRGKTIFTMISCCFGALALRIPLLVLACRLMPDSLGVIGAVAPTVSAVMAVYTCIYVLQCRNVTRV